MNVREEDIKARLILRQMKVKVIIEAFPHVDAQTVARWRNGYEIPAIVRAFILRQEVCRHED
jgi:hypothetical protein